MPIILLISSDDSFRNALRRSMGRDGAAVLGMPNTRDILTQPGARQVMGYDLIVAEVLSVDHDGLSRLVLFRNLHPNTPFIAVSREDQRTGNAYSEAAARALHAWLVPCSSDSLDGLIDTAARALNGELPSMPVAYAR